MMPGQRRRPIMMNVPHGVPPIVESAMAFLGYYDERRCPTWLSAWGQSDGVGAGLPDKIMNLLPGQATQNSQEEKVRQSALKVLYNYFTGEQDYAPTLPEGVKEMMMQGGEHDAPRPARVPVGPMGDPLGQLMEGIPPEFFEGVEEPQTPGEWIEYWERMKLIQEGGDEDEDDYDG